MVVLFFKRTSEVTEKERTPIVWCQEFSLHFSNQVGKLYLSFKDGHWSPTIINRANNLWFLRFRGMLCALSLAGAGIIISDWAVELILNLIWGLIHRARESLDDINCNSYRAQEHQENDIPSHCYFPETQLCNSWGKGSCQSCSPLHHWFLE